MKTYPVVLTIAGSDSSGGAGIQADLKTMSAIGVFGTSAITAITAQNTCEVRDIQGIEPDIVRQQIEAVLDDLPCTTVKLGMLYSRATIETIADCLQRYPLRNIVLDPVMVLLRVVGKSRKKLSLLLKHYCCHRRQSSLPIFPKPRY